MKYGQASGGIHYLGNRDFGETRMSAGYALQLENQLYLGVAGNFWHFRFREKEANSSIVSFSPGLRYQLNHLHFGAVVNHIGFSKTSSQFVQESVAIGIAYYKQSIGVLCELEKFANRDLLSKIALVYQPHTYLSIQYGLSLRRFNQHLGIAYTKAKIRYELAMYYQHHLGTSSGLTATYFE